MYHNDTISAIATPLGTGGIGIVKISGPKALHVITRFFRSKSFNPESARSRHLYNGIIFDPDDGSDLDDVLVSYMKGPSSYTGEDVIEINCHGGFFVLQKVLEISIKAGARLSEPGEFTKRAFLNSRIDLTQAEAVIDIIDSKTEAALKLASRQLNGELSEKAHEIKQNLLDIISIVEASIDFPEDDLHAISESEIKNKIDEIANKILLLVSTFDQGSLYRLGIQAVIIGKPNVGKSSILNALLGDKRVIVSPIPGTTRDIVHETINIKGIPVKLLDTAGLHNSGNEIEKMGIEMTVSKISESDIVIFVLDGSVDLDIHDRLIIDKIKTCRVITVINKVDLPMVLSITELHNNFLFNNIHEVSALYNRGIDELKNIIHRTALGDKNNTASNMLISNSRHKSALEKTYNSLTHILETLQNQYFPELVAVDLQDALCSIGELTGETTTDDILDSIFSKFCIGK